MQGKEGWEWRNGILNRKIRQGPTEKVTFFLNPQTRIFFPLIFLKRVEGRVEGMEREEKP